MLLDGALNTDDHPFSSGGFSDVYKGAYKGLRVCVKKLRVAPETDSEQTTKGDIYPYYSQISSFLTPLTDTFPGSFAVEAIDTSKHCAILRRVDRPTPNRVRVDASWELDGLCQVEPTRRSGPSREPFFVLPPHVAPTVISWLASQRVSIICTLTA